MALSREKFRELEEFVGPDYISDDPALLDSYVYPMASTSLHQGPSYDTVTPRGQAVLLPGSVEEVQAIVKVCNKYRIRFKASSTFWSAMGMETPLFSLLLLALASRLMQERDGSFPWSAVLAWRFPLRLSWRSTD